MNDPIFLLLIQYSANDRQALKRLLEACPTRFVISHAATLAEGLSTIRNKKFNLIITNLFLSDSSGIDTLLSLQKETDLPIVILEEAINEEIIKKTIRLGVQDYLLVEELDSKHLERALINAIERDVMRNSLRAQSFTDELTGLYNRRGFFALFEQQYFYTRQSKKGFFLFLVDLDYLKPINDTYGHMAGDSALRNIAACLKISFRSYDVIGRIGGDEFAILALNAAPGSIKPILDHIHKFLNEINKSKKYPYHLSLSIGMAYFDGNPNVSLEDLIAIADNKLYEEKKIAHGKLGP